MEKERVFMLCQAILLRPYKTGEDVVWFVETEDPVKIRIGPFQNELDAARFMEGSQHKYESFLNQLIERME